MKGSMEDYLKVVTPHLHPALVSPEALSYIHALAQILPSFSVAGFECRLGAKQSQVDFQVKLPVRSLNLPQRFLSSSVWQSLQNLYQEWGEPTSFLHQSVNGLFLEFDLVEAPSPIPIPCILFNLNQEIVSNDVRLIKVVTDWPLKLLNYSTFSRLESNLQRCVNSLPDGAWIGDVGVMLSRPVEAVRLSVKGIPPNQLSDYLMQIGWEEPTNRLSTLVSSLSEFADFIVLSVDVGDTIYPRISLECHLEKQPRFEPRWQLFLDYLVEENLCTPAKRNSLLAWPGLSQKVDQPELWPSNLTWGDRFFGSRAFSVFWRTIYEIKIVYQPNLPLEAKGYLAFGHDWLDAQTLTPQEQAKTEKSTAEKENLTNTDSLQTRLCDRQDTPHGISQYLEEVRSYYDRMNPLIVKYVGKTYQAGLLTINSEADPYRSTNLYCAAHAGIQPGQRVLDAGCGVCGPSIDIAQHIEEVKIDAITLSPAQANTARELVEQAGLTERIQVHIGDFHSLPFTEEIFDIVLFLESTGYSYNHHRLFAEVYRVLRPGGSLYIKEPFRKESSLSKLEQQQLAESNKVYVYKAARMSELVEAISAVGFQNITCRDLSELVSGKAFNKTMLEYKHGFPLLTEFGKVHHRQLVSSPTFFGEIKAFKPS